jgi:hypothetical protein
MKVLIACEESQRVCTAFRERGHEAYSADIQEPSGGHPEWHILGDVLEVLNPKDHLGDFEAPTQYISFKTMDGSYHEVDKWDMIIAHPPCTYLTVTGNRWFNAEKYGDKAIQRIKDREEAAKFFMKFVNADCNKIAIENPIGYMSTYYQKPTQIIQPYEYGHPARKATCLWLKGLPKLQPTNIVEPIVIKYKNGKGTDNPWHMDTMSLPPAERSRERSKTFEGIAAAMAEQWGKDEFETKEC